MKKPVTVRALIKRLNRHLPNEGLKIFQCKINACGHHELGNYYIVDTKMNMINAMHVDIEQLARHEGVLKEYEEIVKSVGKSKAPPVDRALRIARQSH